MGKKSKKIDLSYEDSIARLEEIAEILNNPQTKIQDMMNVYEEGQNLLVHCQSLLDNIEQRIEVINNK